MNKELPYALWLAEKFEGVDVAAELRRLYYELVLTDELYEALTLMVIAAEQDRWPTKAEHLMPMQLARQAIAMYKNTIRKNNDPA